MTLAGRVFSNRYEIQRELAQGGMAEVYLARDQLLSRPVALKALFPEYAREPSFVERFRREAQAAANLNHPNIVAIYDWGQEGGTYFIVMEYVEGRSLRDLIRSEGPLDPNEASEITAEIASALAFAHKSGVVHRDVKPGNVLLTRGGLVKVTDFGIARAGTSDGLTQTGSVMGTATYFSPEQAQGLPVDGRSDVYSLGIVLYEMVTGVCPFTGDSPVSVAYKHVREPPVAPTERNPEVPPDLEQIILTALAKDPEERYQTADDMRADLLRFRRGRPLAAAPITALVAEVPTSAVSATKAEGAYAATMATPRVDDRGRYTGGPTYERKKRNSALIWILTLVGLAAVIGGILYAAVEFGSTQEQVSVPSVVGKKVNDAQQQLQANHLSTDVKRVTSTVVAADTVIAQSPVAGTNVSRGSTITLTVSNGPSQKQIPFDIVNKSEADATAELKALGFVVNSQHQTSTTVTSGFVFDSNPKPGINAPIGSTVTLIVSSGPAPVAIPDVSNLSRDQAEQQLQQAGFSNFDPLQESSNTVPAGAVTRTSPPAGQQVPLDTRIKIYVSTGVPTVTVPEERGKAVAAATADLTAKGFSVTTIEQISPPGNQGKVIDQNPTPGTQVAPGSTIVLTVGVTSTTSTSAPSSTTSSSVLGP